MAGNEPALALNDLERIEAWVSGHPRYVHVPDDAIARLVKAHRTLSKADGRGEAYTAGYERAVEEAREVARRHVMPDRSSSYRAAASVIATEIGLLRPVLSETHRENNDDDPA